MRALVLLLTPGIFGALVAALAAVVRARPRLQGTTLVPSWSWAVVALGAWTTAWGVTALVAVPQADQVWYLAAVLMLCPPLSALGAKRPMSRVWTAFVIVPLILVLGWSAAASAWGHRDRPETWQLDDPVVLGYGLVLIMAAGNHLGTRFRGAVVLIATALTLTVLPLSGLAPEWLVRGKLFARFIAGLLLAAGALEGVRQLGLPWSGATPLDRAWREFRDLFGVVWSRRIQMHLNELAIQHRWPVQLSDAGWLPAQTGQPVSASQAVTPEQSLRWVLRRFVDPEWLDQRLQEPS